MTRNSNHNRGLSTLASLRAVVPNRALQFAEALRIAELQANRLLELTGVSDGPTPSEVVAELPRVRVEQRDLATSGMSYWDGTSWVICVNAAEPRTRQRFTLVHELKHVIDHGRATQLYRGTANRSSESQAEQAADYFAACVLMPKRLIKRAWGERVQRPSVLAALFGVSPQAMDIRLSQLGLTEPRVRCATGPAAQSDTRRRRTYFRQLSVHIPSAQLQGAAA